MGEVRGEPAVSSVVGTVLMLAVTMSAFAGLALVVLDRAETEVEGARADVDVEAVDGRILLQHRGGDRLPLAEGRLLLTVDGLAVTRPLTDLAAQVGDGTSWALGESLCVAGPQPPCLYAEGQVSELRLVQGERLAVAGLPGATGGASYHYVGSATPTMGTVISLAAAQSASDAGVGATLLEAATAQPATSGTVTRSGSAQSATSATNPSNVLTGDLSGDTSDQRATLTDNGDAIEVSGFTAPSGATAITSVTIGYEGMKSSSGGNSPDVLLSYKLSGVAGAASLTQSLTATADAQATVDVTADRAWTVADLSTLAVRVAVTNNPSRDALLDHVYVTVGYTAPAVSTYTLSVVLDVPGVPTDGQNVLQVRYRATSDTFRIQVWDGSAYTTRGAILDATAATLWTYTLTAAEANSGAPRLRIVDVAPDSTAQGSLLLDFVRVQSA